MNDLRTIVFGLLCSLLSQGQLRDQPQPRDQPTPGAVSISGRVQAATGAPIQGAAIRARDVSSHGEPFLGTQPRAGTRSRGAE